MSRFGRARRAARRAAAGPAPAPPSAPLTVGPWARSRSTADIASRSSPSHSSACSPTSRTHQASASERDRATPASTSVSSTLRSGCRSRVITGADSVVNSCRLPPQAAPQATFRPYRCSASRAIEIRSSRVSSRNRLIRPASAAVAAASSAPSTPGGASVPTTRISSRSTVTSGAPVNHSSGSRPANQPAASSAGGRSACCQPPDRPKPRLPCHPLCPRPVMPAS